MYHKDDKEREAFLGFLFVLVLVSLALLLYGMGYLLLDILKLTN